MLFNFFKKKKRRKKNLIILYFLGTLLAIANAIPAYTQSSFLEERFSLPLVSVFFILSNLISIFTIIKYPNLIKKIGNLRSVKLIISSFAVSLLGMAIGPMIPAQFNILSLIIIFLSFISLSISINLIWINMDILIENFSEDSSTGLTRTIYLAMLNFGWIIAPSLSSFLIRANNYSLSFLTAILFLIPFSIIFYNNREHLGGKKQNYRNRALWPILKKSWKNKNLKGIFFISLLLNLFYSSAVVYIPIYLHNYLGIEWSVLGIIFSIMLIPFILFSIPAGWLADKFIGEKEIMGTGMGIVLAALLLFFFIKSSSPVLWGITLFFSRVGASLLESMRESYFFKQVGPKDLEYINFFRTTSPIGYLLGALLALIITTLLPGASGVRMIFLVVAIIFSSSFIFLGIIKDTK